MASITAPPVTASDDGKVAAIVIDNGGWMTKAGIVRGSLSGDDALSLLPSHTDIPTFVGRPRVAGPLSTTMRDAYVGSEAKTKRGIVTLKSPIQRGWVINWDDMEKIWHHTFYNELKVAPEEHKVLLAEPPLNYVSNREKMTQVMFETFNVSHYYLANTAQLALYASGRTTGTIVDSGYGCTRVFPIVDGSVLPHAMLRMNHSGDDISATLLDMINEYGRRTHGSDILSSRDGTYDARDVATAMKEQYGYIAREPLCKNDDSYHRSKEEATGGEQKYLLPDGVVITIPKSIFARSTEPLFQPSLHAFSSGADETKSSRDNLRWPAVGIHQMVYESMMKCSSDVELVAHRTNLLTNIVLSGGTTMLPGFQDRLDRELKQLIITPPQLPISSYKHVPIDSNNTRVRIIAPPDRINSVWQGGALLSSLSSFEPMWITNEEYNENGPSIVHRRCW